MAGGELPEATTMIAADWNATSCGNTPLSGHSGIAHGEIQAIDIQRWRQERQLAAEATIFMTTPEQTFSFG